MTLNRRTPLSNLGYILSEMNSLFDRIFSSPQLTPQFQAGTWKPPVDIYEVGDEIVLLAELPQVKQKEIELRIDENELVIAGERKLMKDVEGGNWSRVERFYGPFERRFLLPVKVDKEAISATFCRGVLEVHLPKIEDKRAKKIEIQVKE
jgi:HSP20 family protein